MAVVGRVPPASETTRAAPADGPRVVRPDAYAGSDGPWSKRADSARHSVDRPSPLPATLGVTRDASALNLSARFPSL